MAIRRSRLWRRLVLRSSGEYGDKALYFRAKVKSEVIKYDKRRHEKRNRIEIMFDRLKDWRRVASRYKKCPKVFVAALVLAASVLFWLWILSLTRSVRFI